MSQELTLIKQENIATISSDASKVLHENQVSQEKCTAAGEALLNRIINEGMTDELDQAAATYIEKSRATVNKMNAKRSPITKLFDEIRKAYTTMENSIDPTKSETIAYKIQAFRNQYAAKKRAEEEERRRQELARQQAEQARKQLKQDIEDDLNNQLQIEINKAINTLTALDNSLTLENYDDTYKKVKEFSTSLPETFIPSLRANIRIPAGININEMREAEEAAKTALKKKFTEMYEELVSENKDYILDRLPSKKANLERIAKANEEEAARLSAQMAERARQEAAEREAEKARKEEEARLAAEAAKQQAEMASLFTQQATVQEYQSKVKVSKKIELLDPKGILPILNTWWAKEGCNLGIEELSKMFKKQITFCEKLANKDEFFIKDNNILYSDDVKAK